MWLLAVLLHDAALQGTGRYFYSAWTAFLL